MADTDTRTDGREKLRSPSQLVPGGGQPARAQLVTDVGKTLIAEGVVAKISGFAAKEIPGVHSMGTGVARRVGQLRNLVPGGSEASTQGVSVEVGEREAAVDLDIVTWYGQSIVDISDAVRRNVIDRVQSMTGLRVIEVNINVDDVFVAGEQNSGMSGSGGNNPGMRSR
ncbi:putative alkaline shock family protein YloU [Micromonospora pisi]|uniref:Putative alkaline shock family protein YloU n=1 Tax=Micromonospora pisi TaxID=589240 RepID=A0A495JCK3_9ACTN|nr:Asp23/Gls24 family envelope stress response protein [Micromonospora pisi]RKR85799.1 putative alkaline shock family protein YloU [Micromonospora pisi]